MLLKVRSYILFQTKINMFYNDPKFQEKYYNLIAGLFAFEKVLRIIPVDFHDKWWKPLWDQKLRFFADLLSEIIQAIFGALTPLILGYAIYNKDYQVILLFGAAYLGIEILNRILLRIRAIYVMQAENSINYAAYNFFLTVDPIFHNTKSSGQIISKIERASRSFGDIINMFLGDAVYIVISFITIIVTLTTFNLKLGVISGITFIILALINGFLSFLNSTSLIKRTIIAQDKKTAISVENLQQNALIRSSFATVEQDKTTKKLILKLMLERSVSWFGSGIAVTVNRILFLVASLVLSFTILDLINQNQMPAVTGVALLVTFLNASNSVLRVGSIIRGMTEKYSEIIDLFGFIRGFGKQTFPVLDEDIYES
jgi:ABC-type multidrug transport system fused ATPase/permease subunit